jgi:hypothetical protein
MKIFIKRMLLLQAFATHCAFSQATFIFQNYHPLGVNAPVFDSEGNRLSSTNYVAVLFGGPTPDSLILADAGVGSMSPVPITAMFNNQAGYFSRAGQVYVDNAPAGGYAWLQVRAWDARLGSSYDEVEALGLGGYGQSPLFQARGGDPISLIPPQPLLGLQSFSLVPEPSTWALLGIGVGFLLWRWRRRQ